MVILDEGLNKLTNDFKTLITQGQWGTGTAVPNTSDTGLQIPEALTLKNVTKTSSGNTAQFTHELASTEANGTSYAEYELQYANGDSLNRVLFGTVNKTAAAELTVITSVNFIRS